MRVVKLLTLSTLFLLSAYPGARAGGEDFLNTYLKGKNWSFQENKGQLTDPAGKPLSDIRYYGKAADVQVYCQPSRLSFVFIKRLPTDKDAPARVSPRQLKAFKPLAVKVEAVRTEMELIGANTQASIVAEEKEPGVTNYYLPHTGAQGVTGVSSYKKIIYKEVYPHIDLVLHAKEQGLEYEFVIHPGGKAGDIQIRWNGLNKTELLRNGGVRYTNAFGSMLESKPQTYMAAKTVPSSFVKKNNVLSFSIGKYDKSQDLVIDPALNWATYYGGTNDDYAWGMTKDASENLYLTGTSLSTAGIATSGAYQTSAGGQGDAFIAKFSRNGSLLWATYYGGEDYDVAYGIAVDTSANVYIAGGTNSTTGISTTGAYQTKYGTGTDAFIAKFSKSGSLNWGTYYGADGQDYGTGIALDSNGNIFVSGDTYSLTGIATSGAFETSFGNGFLGAFMVKFNNSGARQWGTYICANDANSQITQTTGIATDRSGNVLLTGWTDGYGKIVTSGAHQTTPGSSSSIYHDGFLMKFSNGGSLSWGTLYGGEYDDESYSVATDKSSNIYISGYTQSTKNIATSGAFKTSFGGAPHMNAFLTKFNSGGTRQWATYYGDTAEYTLTVTTDDSNYVYITGIAGSNSSSLATSAAYSNTNAGGYDAFLAKFSSSGARKYGTYYGGPDDDIPTSVVSNIFGNAYVAGVTHSTSGIATKGTYQTTEAGAADIFLAKMSTSNCNLRTEIKGPATVCSGDTVTFKAAAHLGSSFTWTLTGGTLLSSSTDSIINIKWGSVGKGLLKLQENNLSGCADSIDLNITIVSPPKPVLLGPAHVCINNTSSFHTTNDAGAKYIWTVSGGTIASGDGTDSISILWPSHEGSGHVKLVEINAGGCSDSAETDIAVHGIPAPPLSGKTLVCLGDKVSYTTRTDSGGIMYWDIVGGNIVSGKGTDSVTVIWSSVGKGSISAREVNAGGCTGSTSKDVDVLNMPYAAWDYKDDSNGTCVFTAQDSGLAATDYQWDFGDGKTGTGRTNQHTFSQSGSYKVRLRISNAAGCNDEKDSTIQLSFTGIAPLNAAALNLKIYPNPFKEQFFVNYALPHAAQVQVTVTDMFGRQVAVLDNGYRSAGQYQLSFKGADYHCAAGLYYVRIVVDQQETSRAVLEMK